MNDTVNESLYMALNDLFGVTTSRNLRSYLDSVIRRMQLTMYYNEDDDYEERLDNLTAVIARKWHKLSGQEQETINNTMEQTS